MRATPLILSFGLLCVSLPATAETASSTKSASARPEARVGSLAPDEARRAERARRRAAEKNAKAAARDTKVTEGKSVAVPGKTSSDDKSASVGVAPVKAAVAPPAPSRVVSSPPGQATGTGDARARDTGPRHMERTRSADRDDRVRDRRDRRYAARRQARRDRFAIDDAGGERRFPRQGMVVTADPQDAPPPGAPPYPMLRRPGEVYMVRVAPPPRAFWGYGPRPFYSLRGPIYAREPIDDDVD